MIGGQRGERKGGRERGRWREDLGIYLHVYLSPSRQILCRESKRRYKKEKKIKNKAIRIGGKRQKRESKLIN
jgi:hypothetical protein